MVRVAGGAWVGSVVATAASVDLVLNLVIIDRACLGDPRRAPEPCRRRWTGRTPLTAVRPGQTAATPCRPSPNRTRRRYANLALPPLWPPRVARLRIALAGFGCFVGMVAALPRDLGVSGLGADRGSPRTGIVDGAVPGLWHSSGRGRRSPVTRNRRTATTPAARHSTSPRCRHHARRTPPDHAPPPQRPPHATTAPRCRGRRTPLDHAPPPLRLPRVAWLRVARAGFGGFVGGIAALPRDLGVLGLGADCPVPRHVSRGSPGRCVTSC
jgi:hypothetical protein